MAVSLRKSVLPQEQQELLRNVIRRTWDVIAEDCLVDEYGNPDESMSISRYDMAELSLDADRWRDQLDKSEHHTIELILAKLPRWGSTEWKFEIKQVTDYAEYGY